MEDREGLHFHLISPTKTYEHHLHHPHAHRLHRPGRGRRPGLELTVMYSLEIAVCTPELRCPHCNAGLSVRWTTEYGDAMPGTCDNEPCPSCNKSFTFECDVYTTYHSARP